jgi:hypothetical protein
MNHRGIYNRHPITECPECCMDAGRRMVTDTVPEKFVVVCDVCGYRTKAHPTQAAATNEWNKKRRKL